MTGYVDVAVLCGLQSTEHTFVRAGAETYQCENERLGEKISSKMHAYLYLYTVLQYKCVKLETNTHTDINIYILIRIFILHIMIVMTVGIWSFLKSCFLRWLWDKS